MMLGLLASIFAVEAVGFFVVAAVHFGAALDVPGLVQPRASAAAVSALCGLVLVGAAFVAVTRRPSAWEIGIGVHVAAVMSMLVIDKVLAPADVTPIYRIGLAVAAVVGILLITPAGKSALGRESRPSSVDQR